MARILPGGTPANESERQVIRRLRDDAPSSWVVIPAVEIRRGDRLWDIDLVVIVPHAVYLIDVKGTRGRIEVAGKMWHPDGRGSYISPLSKLRAHARAVKGMIASGHVRARQPDLARVWVEPLVALTARDAVLDDPAGKDSSQTTTLADLIDVLGDTSRVQRGAPAGDPVPVQPVLDAVGVLVKPRGGPLRFGSWEVCERLGGDDGVQEFRAKNAYAPAASGTVLLRVYEADVYLSDAGLQAQRLRLGNAFEALSGIPQHANVVRAFTFFPDDDESRFVLVLDDPRATALRVHLNRPQLALTADARMRVMRGVLLGLAHVHRYGVLHRALSPSTVLIAENGRPMLTGFDVAKTTEARAHTVADLVLTTTDPAYVAPECQANPAAASPASDVYSAGVMFAEMFLGAPPFSSATEQHEVRSVLPVLELRDAGATSEVAAWLQGLCMADPAARPSAIDAVRALDALLQRGPAGRGGPLSKAGAAGPAARDTGFYLNLPADHELTPKYIVRKRLGRPGTFGVAYRVFDTLEQVDKAIKLVFRDRESVTERLRHEFQILLRLPAHPNLVRVLHADFLPGAGSPIPYLVFEYVEGQDVREMIDRRLLGPADALRLGLDVARGLAHLHHNDVFHCDIKPSNLLWTDEATRLLDFNIAVSGDSTLTSTGGSPRYMPPDGGSATRPTRADLVDRDVFAAAVTLYEAMTGQYPWKAGSPPPGVAAADPRNLPGMSDLAPDLVATLLQAIAPRRSDRFRSAELFLERLALIRDVRLVPQPVLAASRPRRLPGQATAGDDVPPNTNPFVTYLQTLYSQSRRSNRGTRGLDQGPVRVYVPTALDHFLTRDVLDGVYRLVVITGNAGDGKTAFLEHLEGQAAEHHQAAFEEPRANGAAFTVAGRRFVLNHDGSQDEEAKDNSSVLTEFFAPYAGPDALAWPGDQTRVIAINEGRLIDFLATRRPEFPALDDTIRAGLAGRLTPAGVAVVNLNARSVVAASPERAGPEDAAILDRTLRRMVQEEFWQACRSCDLAAACYAHHNARTFGHPTAGPRIAGRLRTLYELVALRGRLHITVRDLRSALAFMLTSGRDCAEIHELYKRDDAGLVLDGFYFSSWMGGDPQADRLLAALREVDIGGVANPQLDRRLDYAGPVDGQALVAVDGRGRHDRVLLEGLFQQLPRGAPSAHDAQMHRRYLNTARRRFFFESIDEDRWPRMLPYRSAHKFLELLSSPQAAAALGDVLAAINRGEGLANPGRLGDALALRVRDVPGGTIRSYRLFPSGRFTLAAAAASSSPYVESKPEALVLRYAAPDGQEASLDIRLDLFELLQNLARGHQPGIEDRQGQLLSLAVFKNILGSVPYQEILLTETGHDLHRITREKDGRLRMRQLPGNQEPPALIPGVQQ
jgi:serine/threonine protein kinase